MEAAPVVLSVTICEVGGKERIVEIPVTPSTSFDDVKKSVSNGAGGHFFEKWRRHERKVEPSEIPYDLIQLWGASNRDVQFIFKPSIVGQQDGASSASPRRSARLQTRSTATATPRAPSHRGKASNHSPADPAAILSSRIASSPRSDIRKLHDQLVKCDANRKKAEAEVDQLATVCSSHEQQIQDIRQQMSHMRSRLAQCRDLAARGRKAQNKPGATSASKASATVSPSITALQQEREKLRKELQDCQDMRQRQSEDLQAGTAILRTRRQDLGRVRKSVEKVSQELDELRRGAAVTTNETENADSGSEGPDPKRRKLLNDTNGPSGHADDTSREPCDVSAEKSGNVTDGGGQSRPVVATFDDIEMDVISSDRFQNDGGDSASPVPKTVRSISQIESLLVGRRGSLRRSSSEYGFSRSRPGSFSARSSVRSLQTQVSSPSKSYTPFGRSTSDSILPATDEGLPDSKMVPAVNSFSPSVITPETDSLTASIPERKPSLASGVISRRKQSSPDFTKEELPSAFPPASELPVLQTTSSISDITSPVSHLSVAAPSQSPLQSPVDAASNEPSIVPIASPTSSPGIMPTLHLNSSTSLTEQTQSLSDAVHAEQPVPMDTEPVAVSLPASPKSVKSILVRRSADVEGNRSSSESVPKRNVRLDPHAVLLDAAFFGELEAVQWAAEQLSLDNLSRGGKDAVTALHAAAVNGWLDCVEYLIAAGAHPNAIDGDGWTPLHCAASDGSCRVLQALIEAGCAVLAPTSDGMTPLEVAIDSQGSADEASTFDDVINMLRDMENRLGVDDRGRVYAAYPYGDGRDIMHVKIEHDEDKASHASDEDDDDDDEAESDYEEQLKVRQTDELCFSTGDCLYILQRPDTNSESNDKWWLAEHASQPSQSRGYVPCTHLSLYPVQNTPGSE